MSENETSPIERPPTEKPEWEIKHDRAVAKWGFTITILALSFMFAAFSVAYIVSVLNAKSFEIHMSPLVWVNTLILAVSSFVIRGAVGRCRKGDISNAIALLRGTFVLGGLFLLLQAVALIPVLLADRPKEAFQLTLWLFAFGLMHGFHIISGLFVLGYLIKNARLGKYSAERMLPIELGSAYWHFLDFLWLWLFALLLWGQYR